MADAFFDVDRSSVPKGNLLFDHRDFGQVPRVLVEVEGRVVADLSAAVFSDGGVVFEPGMPGSWTVRMAADLKELDRGGTPWMRTAGGKDRL